MDRPQNYGHNKGTSHLPVNRINKVISLEEWDERLQVSRQGRERIRTQGLST